MEAALSGQEGSSPAAPGKSRRPRANANQGQGCGGSQNGCGEAGCRDGVFIAHPSLGRAFLVAGRACPRVFLEADKPGRS